MIRHRYNKVGMSRKTDSKNDDRVFGPVFQPDDLVPSTGIGPALPSDLFKQKLNKESESVNYKSPTNFEEIDTIGPLLPGQEIREEWRHLKSGFAAPTPRNPDRCCYLGMAIELTYRDEPIGLYWLRQSFLKVLPCQTSRLKS
ncbi:unnamed protein product, partial [Schistosoma curassoni]|uniref:Uncharacterized protein n=1 Tax=Schistosoma curassoni TaxID=6186 RepID=A0A183L1X5_9TREM